MSNTIQVLYKTPKGTIWNTLQEAQIAHKLESSSIYIESYRMKEIIEVLCSDDTTSAEAQGKMELIPSSDC